MLSSVEIILICCFIAVLSVVEALSARFYLRDFPWKEMLTKPEFFGGVSYLVKRLGLLVCWLVLSVALTIAVASLLKHLLASAGFDFQAVIRNSGVSYFIEAMPTILGVAFYIGFCDLLKIQTRKFQESYRPRHLCAKLAGDTEEENRIIEQAASRVSLVNSLKWLVNFLPKIFLQLYRNFYLDTGRLLTAVSNILVSQYGPETVVRFFEHQHRESNRYRAGQLSLNHLDDNYENSLDWAQYLLTANVRLHGYYQTKKAINSYVHSRKSTANSKREVERIRCKKPIRVTIRSKGLVGYAKLLEYSEGYRGFYITTNLAIDQRERINITIDDTEYTTKVVHRNCFIAQQRIFSGYGLSLAS